MPPTVPPEGLTATRAGAKDLIGHHAIPAVDPASVEIKAGDDQRTTFHFDVRTEAEEWAARFPSAPGGQLSQATDERLAVRGARIVLNCDTGLRATTTAIWLMEWSIRCGCWMPTRMIFPKALHRRP